MLRTLRWLAVVVGSATALGPVGVAGASADPALPAPHLLGLRLHAEIPPGMMQRQAHTLALSLQHGVYQEVTQGGWRGLKLYTPADRHQPPLMEGFFEADGRRRYVECRLAKPRPDCSATYQRGDGLTVEYTFDLAYLDRLAWLDGEVSKLLASFVAWR